MPAPGDLPFAYPYYSPPPSPCAPSPSRSRSDSIHSVFPSGYPGYYDSPSSTSTSTINLSENQTTLTILPTTLSLVNIPRQRAVQGEVCNRILSNLFTSVESADFLAIVANELELSIYADAETIRRTQLIKMAKKEHRMARDSKQMRKPGWKPMEYSSKRWSVLQVDTHDDEDAGTRVHQISSCLSSAGIPILFVSSHSADFVLVKSGLLPDVVRRLRKEGFSMYDEHGLSPYLAPAGGRGDWPLRHETGEDVILPPLSLDDPFDMHAHQSPNDGEFDSLPSPAPSSDHSVATVKGPEYVVNPISGTIACVGMAEEHASQWLLKIFRLVASPHQILLDSGRRTRSRRRRSAMSARQEAEGERPLSDILAEDARSDGSSSSSGGGSGPEAEWSDSYDVEYDSDESSSSRSSRDSSLSMPSRSPSSSTSSIQHPPLSLPVTPPRTSPEPSRVPGPTARLRSVSAPQAVHPAILALPFFSFIRTRGATSLTASTRVLAKLFSKNERYMVMSAGELDVYEDDSDEDEEDEEYEDAGAPRDGSDALNGPLRCLQIDFSAFGLDKVGLATRISDALLGSQINHLYTSTLRTANVFVSEPHFHAARAVLLEIA
ncbi:hypothetical protein CALVIDRAFT_265484 [Calocera viscosa TUFC12733]|uniref:CASTOR ACT domain-containing protein n=1 Tax=Calocera viscosa (strain TUFC12733) TaxID=1330018 RepID=A0A167J613_CALVF|nr:hypothetical protein CALVIDRAFT_265484 [Calocera viscosa TUFC12733]